MIVIIQKDTQEPALRQLAVRLMNQGVRIGRTPGQDADVLTLVGDTWRLDPEGLAALPYVLDVRRITPPYRLASRAAHPENTVVEVGSARIGAEFCLIAGPCAVESQVQMAGVARRVKAAGAQLLRGGAFKPRTSPYSFQGLGQPGISMLTEAGREAGLPVVTEITDPRQLEDLDQVDILQVGARNMQNFALLQALGQVRKPVLLKRGMSATVTELLQAAEYILAGGNRAGDPVRAGHPDLRDRQPCHSGHCRHSGAEKADPPAGDRGPQSRRRTGGTGGSPGAGRRGRRSRRPDGGGARPPGLRLVRWSTGPVLRPV